MIDEQCRACKSCPKVMCKGKTCKIWREWFDKKWQEVTKIIGRAGV